MLQTTKRVLYLLILIQISNCINVEHLKFIFSERDCIAGSLLSLENFNTENHDTEPFETIQTLELPSPDKSVLSQLQELAQYHSIGVSYELVKEEGPSHNPTFTIDLYLGDETYTALGNSLKEAKRKAAMQAIKNTKFEHPPLKIKENEKVLTPTVLLNNLAAKLGLEVSYFVVNNDLLEELQSTDRVIEPKQRRSQLQRLNDSLHSNYSLRYKKDETNLKGPFKVKVIVNGEKFIGTAHTIQNAKHEAASKTLKSLKKKKDQDNLYCLKEGSEKDCKDAKQNMKSPISLVYEAAQKHHLDIDFEVMEEKGPSHKKVFLMKCTVGEFEAIGEGNSKKEAKRIASENMLQKLKNLPIQDDKKQPKEMTPKETKHQKRRKKKKDKIIKTTLDKIDRYVGSFVEFGADVINKFTGSKEPKPDIKNNKKQNQSPTNEVMELGKILNLNMQFLEVKDAINDKVFTILDLGTNPAYICIGEGISEKNSRDLASRNGIKFLYQLGFLDNLLEKTLRSESNNYKEEVQQKFWLQVIDEEAS